jgi:type IV pilus assembly protein PilY1
MRKSHIFLVALLANVFSFAQAAPLISPSNSPLETGTASSVKPNVMFILDDSGSMGADYIGDEIYSNYCSSYISNGYMTSTKYHFKTDCGAFSPTLTQEPNFASTFNPLYYNENIEYKVPPALNTTGPIMVQQSFYSARYNGFSSTFGYNLETYAKEVFYCTKASASSTEIYNTTICKRNGVDNISADGTFDYYTQGYPFGAYKYKVSYAVPLSKGKLRNFSILAKEFCDSNLINCSNTKTTTYANDAKVRWCRTSADATTVSLVTGTSSGIARCQKNYDSSSGYIYPRYGKFKRNSLTMAELNNFANWYSYYRDRLNVMKSSLGLAFEAIDDKTRVGFITINPGSPVSSNKFLKVDDFNTNHKTNFYNKLYSQTANGMTPNREALSRVGRYFAGLSTGINSGMITSINPDPVQYSCQQNFAILSTDGISNSNAGVKLDGTQIINEDNINAGFSTRAVGAYDGGGSSANSTLSDVAMYYYKTDLRTAGALATNNVPVSSTDPNSAQHMVTYTVSFGLNGKLNFSQDYISGKNADFEAIKLGSKNWPQQTYSSEDVWHAAVNGRGVHYSASNSSLLVDGLKSALSSVMAQVGSSSSAATPSPNITQTNNYVYSTTYRTVKWDGEIKANTIDPTTGNVNLTPLWTAQSQLNTNTARKLYYISNGVGNSNLIDFGSILSYSEGSLFKNKCSLGQFSQCVSLDATQKSLIDSGTNLVNYIKGQNTYEETNVANPLFRTREFLLGDIVNSNLTYVDKPAYKWTDDGYQDFVTSNSARRPQIYVGANDGFLHAFDVTNGAEKWAVAPRQTLSKMYKLADRNYFINHEFFVDGNIQTMDVFINGVWKTILVSGMGSGSKGYFALDVTNPDSPKSLWEVCTDSSICSNSMSELGYSYGNPIITKRYFDDKWVVYISTGYDNSTGAGKIYELDAANGSLLRTLTVSTAASATNQVGLSKMNAFFDNYGANNKAKFLYAGDLNGNIWKWDLTDSSLTSGSLLGTATDPNGVVQPITTTLELGKINTDIIVFAATGKFLTTTDFTNNQIQSVYAIKDNGTNYGVLRNNSSFVQQALTTASGESKVSNNSVDWTTNGGWFIDFTSETGERVNIDPKLAAGVLNITTNIPGASECTIGGSSWIYQIDYGTGSYIDETTQAIGNKSSVGLIVGQIIVQLGNYGNLKNFLTDAGGGISTIDIKTKKSKANSGVRKIKWGVR